MASIAQSRFGIVGAGLMGRLLAVELAQAGAQVDLYDQGGPDAELSAARVAAAMLAPLAESAITEDTVVNMGVHSLSRWPEIIAKLASPVFFQQNGSLILWHRQDANDAERFIKHLQKNQRNNPALTEPEMLDSVRLQEIEPSVADRFSQGLYLPNEGQLDNRQLLHALATELSTLPVNLHWHQSPDPQAMGQSGQYDWVIDCRGLGAKADWPESMGNTLRGVRGEVIRLYAPEVNLLRPTRLIHPRYPIYIAPKENHVYVVGATEIESDDYSEMSVRSAMELLSAVYTVHSGFAEARILEMATQCRPTLKNNLPEVRIESGTGLSKRLSINGLYRHGFMIAPAILDSVIELLEGGSSHTAKRLGLKIADASVDTVAACV
jgi:glycine oxidase